MTIAAHDDVGVRADGTGEELVIGRVGAHRIRERSWRAHVGRDQHQIEEPTQINCRVAGGHASRNVLVLVLDLWTDSDGEATLRPGPEDLRRRTAEDQPRHQDVGVQHALIGAVGLP